METVRTDTTNNQAVVKKTKGVNFFKAGFFVLLIFILVLIGISAYIYSQGKMIFSIPLSINNPAVLRASFVYAFQTKVAGLEEKDGKTILKTELKTSDNLPEFVIDNNTNIVLVQNGIDYKTKKDILRPGVGIYVYLSYNIKTKQWLTTRVAVVNPITTKITLPPAPSKLTSSASGKLKQSLPIKKPVK